MLPLPPLLACASVLQAHRWRSTIFWNWTQWDLCSSVCLSGPAGGERTHQRGEGGGQVPPIQLPDQVHQHGGPPSRLLHWLVVTPRHPLGRIIRGSNPPLTFHSCDYWEVTFEPNLHSNGTRGPCPPVLHFKLPFGWWTVSRAQRKLSRPCIRRLRSNTSNITHRPHRLPSGQKPMRSEWVRTEIPMHLMLFL